MSHHDLGDSVEEGADDKGSWHLRRRTQVRHLDVSPKPVFKNSEDSSMNQDDPAGRKMKSVAGGYIALQKKKGIYT